MNKIFYIVSYVIVFSSCAMSNDNWEFTAKKSNTELLPADKVLKLYDFQGLDLQLKYLNKKNITLGDIDLIMHSFKDSSEKKHSFIELKLSIENIIKELNQSKTQDFYVTKYGAPIGIAPSYLGDYLQNTWDLALLSDGDDNKFAYYRVSVLFKPKRATKAKNFTLISYKILRLEKLKR